MSLHYKSTRNSDLKVTASEAILTGLAPDGGLFVPEQIPVLDIPLSELKKMSYQETAYAVMKKFLTDFTDGSKMGNRRRSPRYRQLHIAVKALSGYNRRPCILR